MIDMQTSQVKMFCPSPKREYGNNLHKVKKSQ